MTILAKMDLGEFKRKMRTRMGKNADIQAELYWRIANGYDDAPVSPYTLQGDHKSIGHQMTLPIDYVHRRDLLVVLEGLSALKQILAAFDKRASQEGTDLQT